MQAFHFASRTSGKFRAIKLGKRMDNLLFSLLEVGTSDLNKWAGV